MVTFATAKTAQELRDASALTLCYDDEDIEAFIAHRDREGLLAALLAIPGADACWALAAWLPVEKRAEWAQASARRAQEHAHAYAAAPPPTPPTPPPTPPTPAPQTASPSANEKQQSGTVSFS